MPNIAHFSIDGTVFNIKDVMSFEDKIDILAGFTKKQGYYYKKDGTKVNNSNCYSLEHIPYDITRKQVFSYQPILIGYDSSNAIVYYVGQDKENTMFVLPQRSDISYFHISTNSDELYAFSELWHKTAWKSKTCVVYGDSIACGRYSYSGVVDHPFTNLACNMLGIEKVTNKAVGGAGFSDGGTADSTIWVGQMKENQNPWNEANLIIVSAGTNDWGHDSPLGQLGDESISTFYGGVFSVLNSLKVKNRNLGKVICVLPIPRGSGSAVDIEKRKNGINLTMRDYINAMINVCNALCIEYVTPNELYMHPTYLPGYFVDDKLHPNAKGHQLMGAKLAERIAALPPKTGESYTN